jgi:hypothetical protein
MPTRFHLLGLALVLTAACSDEPDASTPAAPADLPYASFDLSGRILGPVESDDESDIEITLAETKGVAFDVNFVRLTCNNRASSEWGASTFVAELGSNRVAGGTRLVFRRHYACRSSGRPQEVLADLTDANGHHHRVTAAPYHPHWPGA